MRIPQDARFRHERARFALRFGCEDCAMFELGRGGCAHGYPTGEHREARYDDPEAPLVFCKEWECA
jgi:hypothetical protein